MGNVNTNQKWLRPGRLQFDAEKLSTGSGSIMGKNWKTRQFILGTPEAMKPDLPHMLQYCEQGPDLNIKKHIEARDVVSVQMPPPQQHFGKEMPPGFNSQDYVSVEFQQGAERRVLLFKPLQLSAISAQEYGPLPPGVSVNDVVRHHLAVWYYAMPSHSALRARDPLNGWGFARSLREWLVRIECEECFTTLALHPKLHFLDPDSLVAGAEPNLIELPEAAADMQGRLYDAINGERQRRGLPPVPLPEKKEANPDQRRGGLMGLAPRQGGAPAAAATQAQQPAATPHARQDTLSGVPPGFTGTASAAGGDLFTGGATW